MRSRRLAAAGLAALALLGLFCLLADLCVGGGPHERVTSGLWAAGEPTRSLNLDNCTLCEAAVSTALPFVERLLHAGADVNVALGPWFTPLYRAAWHGNVDAITALIAAAADVNATTLHAGTPLPSA